VKEKIVNIMGLLVPVLLFVALVGSLIKSKDRARSTKKLIGNIEIKLQKAEDEKKKLEDQYVLVQSEKYIEEQLRNKLGLVKDGEVVLVLPDEEILKKLAPNIPKEEETKPLPNWRKWMNLFL